LSAWGVARKFGHGECPAIGFGGVTVAEVVEAEEWGEGGGLVGRGGNGAGGAGGGGNEEVGLEVP